MWMCCSASAAEAAQAEVLAGLLAASIDPAAGGTGEELIGQGEPGQEVAPGVQIGQSTLPRA